jgi:hypothetical protein
VKIKLDENIPASAGPRLVALRFDVHTVLSEGLTGKTDRLPDSEQWRPSDYLVAWFAGPDVESWRQCFVVATPHKLRVQRPSR